MAPSPIPAPLPPWARALLQVAPAISIALQEVLDHFGVIGSTEDPDPAVWMHCQCIGQPLGSTEQADNFVTTFDVVNITGGEVDSSWTTADTDKVKDELQQMMAGWASRMSTDYRWTEIRMYRRSFNPLTVDAPFAPSGPPHIIYPSTFTGTVGSFQAPQVAVTTTERTAYPGHWGRNYWPHPGGSIVSTGGYISTAAVDSWALAVQTAYEELMAAEFFPVIPVTQYSIGGVSQAVRGLLTVSEIQMDNLFDVQRSRRPKKATYRKVLPL